MTIPDPILIPLFIEKELKRLLALRDDKAFITFRFDKIQFLQFFGSTTGLKLCFHLPTAQFQGTELLKVANALEPLQIPVVVRKLTKSSKKALESLAIWQQVTPSTTAEQFNEMCNSSPELVDAVTEFSRFMTLNKAVESVGALLSTVFFNTQSIRIERSWDTP